MVNIAFPLLTVNEVAVTIDRLNRMGSGWQIVLSDLPAKPRRVYRDAARVWHVVMPAGEHFTHLPQQGWLHIGRVPQVDGRVPSA